MSLLTQLWLEGLVGAVVLFLGLWVVELRQRDASLVDAGWSASLGALALWYALRGDGLAERRWLLAALVGLWSLRLTYHIVVRHAGTGEDGRYRSLRNRFGDDAHRFFFVFYQAQALLAVFLSLPFLLIALDPSPSLHASELAGFGLALVGVVFESVADRQLQGHRSLPWNRGKTCRTGLWRYSRHPNYFFEWLVWCGFAVAAFRAPHGWMAVLSPAIMLLLILKVTGIPPSEQRALESRGDDYRRYQRSTSAFVPWFPEPERETLS